MAKPFGVIRTVAARKGQLEAFRQFLRDFFETIEANEPDLLALNAYANQGGTHSLELATPEQIAIGAVHVGEIPGIDETPAEHVQGPTGHPQAALRIDCCGGSRPLSGAIRSLDHMIPDVIPISVVRDDGNRAVKRTDHQARDVHTPTGLHDYHLGRRVAPALKYSCP